MPKILFLYIAYVQFDHFLNWFRKQIWNKNVHFNSIFLKSFGKHNKHVFKNEFPIVIFKMDLANVGVIFTFEG